RVAGSLTEVRGPVVTAAATTCSAGRYNTPASRLPALVNLKGSRLAWLMVCATRGRAHRFPQTPQRPDRSRHPPTGPTSARLSSPPRESTSMKVAGADSRARTEGAHLTPPFPGRLRRPNGTSGATHI